MCAGGPGWLGDDGWCVVVGTGPQAVVVAVTAARAERNVVVLIDPTADMHIWGAWADGTQAVTVALPPAPYLNQLASDRTWVPVLKHQFSAGGGDGENILPAVDPSTGALSAPLTSLSPVGFLMLHCVGTGSLISDGYKAALTTLRANSSAVYVGYDTQGMCRRGPTMRPAWMLSSGARPCS